MQIEVEIDDLTFSAAQRYCGLADPGEVLRFAIKAFVERKAALALIALGGSDPDLKPVPRRRSSRS